MFGSDQFGIDAGFVDGLRLRSGDVHGDIVRDFVVAALDVNEHADARAVDVVGEQALGFDAFEAAEGHVFADLADKRLADVFDRAFAERQRGESGEVGRGLFGHELDGVLGHLDEFGVLGNEVRFGVDFEDGARLAVFGDVDNDDAFGGDAASSLARLVAELDAKDLFGLGHVAVGFREGLLAFHHRRVGLQTQFLDHRGGNSSHVQSP